jgi:hypothetical protein
MSELVQNNQPKPAAVKPVAKTAAKPAAKPAAPAAPAAKPAAPSAPVAAKRTLNSIVLKGLK